MFPKTQPTRLPVSLHRLFPRASFVGCADIGVEDATERSGEVTPHTLFAAIPGTKADGHDYISDAIARGAAALLVHKPVADVSVPQCVVPNVRKAFSELCCAMYGFPSRRMKTAGVTGTNGKTTTTFLLRAICNAGSHPCGVLGTVEYSDGHDRRTSSLTTPDSKSLAGWLGAMVARHTTHAAMELSSHALDQDRAAGVALDVAVVTNITQDHFDYHGDFASYRTSKQKIFELLKRNGSAVLNADDPGCATLRDAIGTSRKVTTFGLEHPADATAEIVHESTEGSRFVLRIEGQEIDVFTPLIGRHNVSNCLAAAVAAHHMGLSLSDIAAGIDSLDAVPGRLERVDGGQPFDVFVDYAHTDDALRRCVRFLKSLTRGRVICVFGAGGDRDKTKRPLLGRAAAEADLVVVTSDNPRTEKPEAIIDDILAGFRGSKQPFLEIDRASAIRWALQHAIPGDCVLVAGKGHETEQIIGTQRHPFDDRQVARGILKELAGSHQRVRLPA